MMAEPKRICQIYRFQLLFKMNFKKGFTLIELLVVVAILGILSTIGVVAYTNYTTSAKITAAKDQHYKIKNFIEASYGQCALGNSYLALKTCDYGGFSCNGLSLGTISQGTIKRPCKSGSGSASNTAYHFVFHFNNSDFINPYNLDGPVGNNIGGKDPKQCCLMQSWDPRTKGRTHIWGNNTNNLIYIKTNIGNKNGSNEYLLDQVQWPGSGF